MKNQIISNSRFIFFYQIVLQGIKFGKIFLFGRYLSPSSLGLYSVVLIVGGLLESFSRTGVFDCLLANRKEPTTDELNNAWTLDLIRYSFLGTLCLVFADPISIFLGNADAAYLIRLYSLSFFLNGIRNNSVLLLLKRLEFKRYLSYNLIPQVGTFIVIILAIVSGGSLTILVLSLVAQSFLLFVLSYVFVPSIPAIKIDLGLCRKQLNYGQWLFYQNLLEFFSTRSDRIIITKMIGMSALGSYTFAASLSSELNMQVKSMTRTLLMPYFSLVQNDKSRVLNSYVSFISLLLFFWPVIYLLSFYSGDLVILFFGEKWREAAIIIPILICSLGICILLDSCEPLFHGTQKPSIYFRLTGLRVVFTCAFLLLLTYYYGMVGAALAIILANFLAIWFWVQISSTYFNKDKTYFLFEIIKIVMIIIFQSALTFFVDSVFSGFLMYAIQIIIMLFCLLLANYYIFRNAKERPSKYIIAIGKGVLVGLRRS